ncbi:MAG: alanine racemase [Phycisphaerae bacterium]|nr:alanine racemase [Phycisphaerae bacterium]
MTHSHSVARMQTEQTLQQCQLHVDLHAIESNCTVIRNHIGPECGFCAVVKADGYGLGAARVASRLSQHADLLAVYSPDEAGELLAKGITAPILVLAPVYSIDRFHPVYRGLASGTVHLTIHSREHVEALAMCANRFGFTIPVHLKIDTGLRRGGCELMDTSSILEDIHNHPRLELKGVMTHFASAVHDEVKTKEQHDLFASVISDNKSYLPNDCLIHEANTAAMVNWKATHLNMVRVGLAWTGTVPNGVELLEGLKPVAHWRTSLAHVRTVKKGEAVGYSGRWIAKRDSLIGIVPVGYAAGYPMGVGQEGESNCASVKVLGQQEGDAKVIGAVCMDQIAIDVTEYPFATVGTAIELMSSDVSSKASLASLAEVTGVVPHAIISRISPKVKRVYKQSLYVEQGKQQQTASII